MMVRNHAVKFEVFGTSWIGMVNGCKYEASWACCYVFGRYHTVYSGHVHFQLFMPTTASEQEEAYCLSYHAVVYLKHCSFARFGLMFI